MALAALGLLNPNFAPFAEDEGTYTTQARSVWHGLLSPYWYWYDHPPVAWVQLSPLLWICRLVGLGGDSPMEQARFVIGLYFVASTGLLYVLARRLRLPRLVSIGVVVVFLSSPLTQENLRKVYIDNVALPWLLAAFVIVLRPRRHWWDLVVSGAAMAVAVLSKETVLLVLPGLLGLAMMRPPIARWRAAASVLAPMAGIGLLYPLYALSRGELPNLVSTLRWQLLERPGSGWFFDPASLRYRVVTGWLDVDGFLTLGGLAAAAVLLFVARDSWPLALAVAVPAGILVLSKGYLPAVFINVTLPFLALAIGLAVWQACRRLPRPGWTAGVLALGAVILVIGTGNAGARMPSWDNANRAHEATVNWVADHVAVDATVLTDDTMQADLYEQGRTDPWLNLWVHKLDTDPYAAQRLPHGWRDVDYVIATPAVYGALDQPSYTNGREALQHSHVVATISDGSTSIDVRRVVDK
jgi:hypothetical protein